MPVTEPDRGPNSDLAQDHLDRIHHVIDFLMETHPYAFVPELSEKLQALVRSFENYRAERPTSEDPRDFLYDSSLCRNYLTAQSSVLLVFCNTVTSLAAQHHLDVLDEPIARLNRELDDKYRMFFSVPRPIRG